VTSSPRGAPIPSPENRLGGALAPQLATHGGCSGFHLLANGRDAFVARVALIEAADATLDLQYYIFRKDTTGSIIVDRLLEAADRGVRVRLLLDDWGTLDKNDVAVAELDAHPGIEIRLFNPYRHRSPLKRLGELLTSFARVNRRMHNKQLIADGQAVVLGGRNIGDEYFELGDLQFQDIDVLGAGPIAAEAEASFEAYWNSPAAVPMASLGNFTFVPEAAKANREALRQHVAGLRDSAYARALAASDFARALRAQELGFHWSESSLLFDPPDKVTKPVGTATAGYLGEQLTRHAANVQSELLLASAYFVPGKRGIAFFHDQRRRDVHVRILTNSLAATDVWLVHSAYRKYRRALLADGVAIYELKPGGQAAAGIRHGLGSSRASLHAKTFVIDRRAVFIGSVNIDPRSLVQNTEVGVLVRCPGLAQEVAALFDRWMGAPMSYQVELHGSGLQWTGEHDGKPVRFTCEPQAGLWRRLGAAAFSYLPIESQI
jgi:putative cardiolipin synthase